MVFGCFAALLPACCHHQQQWVPVFGGKQHTIVARVHCKVNIERAAGSTEEAFQSTIDAFTARSIAQSYAFTNALESARMLPPPGSVGAWSGDGGLGTWLSQAVSGGVTHHGVAIASTELTIPCDWLGTEEVYEHIQGVILHVQRAPGAQYTTRPQPACLSSHRPRLSLSLSQRAPRTQARGDLFLSNYRLLFVSRGGGRGGCGNPDILYAPLGCIAAIWHEAGRLSIHMKDCRRWRVTLERSRYAPHHNCHNWLT